MECLTFKDIKNGIKKPEVYKEKDWNAWAGRHKGTWNKKVKGKPVSDQDDAQWRKAKKDCNGDVIQEVEWINFKRPLGYNITFDCGLVGGLDPKPGKKHMWPHYGIPFSKECCRFILWVIWADKDKKELAYFLEGIDCKGNKTSVTVKVDSWGYGKWKVDPKVSKVPKKK